MKLNYFIEYVEIQESINVLLEMSQLLLKDMVMTQYIQEAANVSQTQDASSTEQSTNGTVKPNPEIQAMQARWAKNAQIANNISSSNNQQSSSINTNVSAKSQPAEQKKVGFIKKAGNIIGGLVSKMKNLVMDKAAKEQNEQTEKKMEAAVQLKQQNPTLKDKMLNWAQKSSWDQENGFQDAWRDQVPRLRDMLTHFIETDTVKSPFGPGMEQLVENIIKTGEMYGKNNMGNIIALADSRRFNQNMTVQDKHSVRSARAGTWGSGTAAKEFQKLHQQMLSDEMISQLQLTDYKLYVDDCIDSFKSLNQILDALQLQLKSILDDPAENPGQEYYKNNTDGDIDPMVNVQNTLQAVQELAKTVSTFFSMKMANEWVFDEYYRIMQIHATQAGNPNTPAKPLYMNQSNMPNNRKPTLDPMFRNVFTPSDNSPAASGKNPWNNDKYNDHGYLNNSTLGTYANREAEKNRQRLLQNFPFPKE